MTKRRLPIHATILPTAFCILTPGVTLAQDNKVVERIIAQENP